MRKRSLSLSNHGISSKRYKELCGFCEQYPDWIKELRQPKELLKSPNLDGMPKGSGTSDIVANVATQNVLVAEKVRIIEETAKEASSDLWKVIIQNVCYEVPYYSLDVPCSKTAFSDIRRYFFYLLSQKRQM